MSALGLVSVPVVIAVAGAEAWGRVAVAQAMGLLFETFVSFGWPVVGAAEIAASDSERREALVRAAFASRVLLAVPAAFVIGGLTFTGLTGAVDPWVEVIAAMAPVIGGLGLSWVFVGESSPSRYNLFDVLPRVVGTVVGLILIGLTGHLLAFVLSQFAGQAASVVLSHAACVRRYATPERRKLRQSLGLGFATAGPGAASALVSSAYQNAPLVIIGLVASPGEVAIYALADRFLKLGALGVVPVTQTAQSWVPAASGAEQLRARIRVTVMATAVVSLIVVGLMALLVPFGGTLLSAGDVTISTSLAAAVGTALGALLLGAVVGRACLVPMKMARAIAWAPLAALVVGVPAQYGLGSVLGALGVGLGLALSEVVAAAVVCTVLAVGLSKLTSDSVERKSPK